MEWTISGQLRFMDRKCECSAALPCLQLRSLSGRVGVIMNLQSMLPPGQNQRLGISGKSGSSSGMSHIP
jgi:hypothetical protein